MTAVGTQIDSDRRLLDYKCYEEYLDSLVTPVDFCYLRSTKVVRQLAELGYRHTGTLDKDTFYRRLKAVKDLLFPIRRPYELTSEFVTPCDEFMQELALRERTNRLKIISTIIFVRHYTKQQFEISSYIDFSQRLVTENWLPYFQGTKRLAPHVTDLAYYHWRTNETRFNNTPNFESIVDPKKGLLFKCLHDRKLIVVDPNVSSPGIDTTRVRVYCANYEHVVLFDHVIRLRI